MKKVIFYLIDDETKLTDPILLPHEKLMCQIIINSWKQGLRMLVACQDQLQAEKIDEYLWQQNFASFVPHNLIGEGMKGGSPVEIAWVGKKSNSHRPLLINLQESFPEFATMYNDIIDVVPAQQQLKNQARERYMAYKNVGFNLKTINLKDNLISHRIHLLE